MKIIGMLLLGLGGAILIFGFQLDTTVATGIGRVHNVGLMNEKQNVLIVGGVLAVLGTLFGIMAALVRSSSPDAQSISGTRQCPYCAELVKAEATICKHCGKDLPPAKTGERGAATDDANASAVPGESGLGPSGERLIAAKAAIVRGESKYGPSGEPL